MRFFQILKLKRGKEHTAAAEKQDDYENHYEYPPPIVASASGHFCHNFLPPLSRFLIL